MLLASNLFSYNISSIKNISNGRLVFDYDLYSGTILRHENRLIVTNKHKVEEFEILDGGQLNRLSFIPIRNSVANSSIIHEGRLYVSSQNDLLLSDSIIQSMIINVIDINESPMKKMGTFVAESSTLPGDRFSIYGNHVLVTDYANRGVHVFNKHTFQHEGYINNIVSIDFRIFDSILVQSFFNRITRQYTFRFYEINDLLSGDFKEISSLVLPSTVN